MFIGLFSLKLRLLILFVFFLCLSFRFEAAFAGCVLRECAAHFHRSCSGVSCTALEVLGSCLEVGPLLPLRKLLFF